MILWTIQDMAAWERLRRKGVLRGDGRRVPAYYRHAYRWMSDQMRLRLPPHHARFHCQEPSSFVIASPEIPRLRFGTGSAIPVRGNRDCHASPWVGTDRNGIIAMRMEVENGKDSLDI